jgi:hypothetical protein
MAFAYLSFLSPIFLNDPARKNWTTFFAGVVLLLPDGSPHLKDEPQSVMQLTCQQRKSYNNIPIHPAST